MITPIYKPGPSQPASGNSVSAIVAQLLPWLTTHEAKSSDRQSEGLCPVPSLGGSLGTRVGIASEPGSILPTSATQAPENNPARIQEPNRLRDSVGAGTRDPILATTHLRP